MTIFSWLYCLILASFFAARANAGLTPLADKYLDEGLHHLYNLDYEKSRASFHKIIETEPDRPFGYLFEAGGIWWQSAMEYGLFKDTPTLRGLFEADIKTALRKVDALEASPDKATRADGHFVEGMTLGTLGQWEMMRGHWVRAYFTGKKALKHLKKTLKLDEQYYDADLGLGVFEYQADHFGGMLRVFSEIGGIHGDEKKGLELMNLAAQRGRNGSRQAAQFLLSITIADRNDYATALLLAERLQRDFPESVYFKFIAAMLNYRLGRLDESLRLGREIFEQSKADPTGFNRKLLSLACGLTGDKCLDRDDAQQGVIWFSRAIDSEPAPKVITHPAKHAKHAAAPPVDSGLEQWLSLNHLYRAYAHDILGQNDAAERDYHWVLDHSDFSDNHARAKECLEIACDAKPLLLYMRAMSTSTR